jgi:chemotaxis protein CheD
VPHTVSISDAKTAAGDSESLITYSLGSCIGVSLYDPMRKVAGLLHFQLPTSTMDANRAAQNPCMFADSGFAQLLAMMAAHGADKKRLKCKIAGGAKMLADNSSFDIGKRNHTAIRKVLWQHGILCDSEDCGGNQPRTMTVLCKDGTVTLKRGGELVAMK